MEFEGIVFKVLPETSGTSARGEWFRQDVVFEMQTQSPYTRKVCVKFFNKRDEVANLVVGASYIVTFDVESREFNGRWYTDVNARKVQPNEAAHIAAQQPSVAPQAAPMPSVEMAPMPTIEPSMPEVGGAGVVDDLPF